jgi:hypothetical protein
MSTTAGAGGKGEAGPVTALSGPAAVAPQEAAMALMDVAATDQAVERMHAKVAKAERQAGELVSTARDGLDQATAEAQESLERAAALLGGGPQEILDAARAVAAEHDRHSTAMGKIAAALGGEG